MDSLEEVDRDGDRSVGVQSDINELDMMLGPADAVLASKRKSGAGIMGKDPLRILPK